jgi:hypothetical protein
MSVETKYVFKLFVIQPVIVHHGKSAAKMDFAEMSSLKIKQFAHPGQTVKRIKYVAKMVVNLLVIQLLNVQMVLLALMNIAVLSDAGMIMIVALGCIAVMVNAFM